MSPGATRCDHPHMAWTVLIVDDHPGFRGFARRMLEADGFTVVGEAGDGGSAVEAAARLRPALVLLDVMLPDRDGFAVARELSDSGTGATVVPHVEPRGRGLRRVGSSAARREDSSTRTISPAPRSPLSRTVTDEPAAGRGRRARRLRGHRHDRRARPVRTRLPTRASRRQPRPRSGSMPSGSPAASSPAPAGRRTGPASHRRARARRHVEPAVLGRGRAVHAGHARLRADDPADGTPLPRLPDRPADRPGRAPVRALGLRRLRRAGPSRDADE